MKRLLLLLALSVFIQANNFQCKTEEFLYNTKLAYNDTADKLIDDYGLTNFMDIYKIRQKVYKKILSSIKSDPNYKTILTCNNEIECNEKAKKLAKYLTFQVSIEEKWKNLSYMSSEIGKMEFAVFWRQLKNAWKFSLNTFLSKYSEGLQYLTNYVDYQIDFDIAFSNSNEAKTINKTLTSLIPHLSDLIKKNDIDSFSKVSEDIEKISNLLGLEKTESLASFSKDLTKLKSILDYLKLYYEMQEEVKEGKNCIDLHWFTYRELDYVNGIDKSLLLSDLTEVDIDLIKDISKILDKFHYKHNKIDKVVDIFNSMFNGFSLILSSRETELQDIRIFAGLTKKKLEYNTKEMNKFIINSSSNRINLRTFEQKLIYSYQTGDSSDKNFIESFIKNYNTNTKYFKKYYKNEILKPEEHMLMSIPLMSYFGSYKKEPFFIEKNKAVDILYFEKVYKNRIPLNGDLIGQCTNPKIYIFGRNNIYYTYNIDKYGFFENPGDQFQFKLSEAYPTKYKDIYYYKYAINCDEDKKIPIFVKLSGDKYSFRANSLIYGKQDNSIILNDNWGILLFKFDKYKYGVLKMAKKFNIFRNFIVNKHNGKISFFSFIRKNEFINLINILKDEILNKKYINLNASKYIDIIDKKLNLTKSEYIDNKYLLAYAYVISKILYNQVPKISVINGILKDIGHTKLIVRRYLKRKGIRHIKITKEHRSKVTYIRAYKILTDLSKLGGK